MEADIGLANPPLPAELLPMTTGGILEQRQEALYPVVDGGAVDREAACSERLDYVSIAEAIAHVPPHSEGNQVVGEAAAGEGALRAGGEAAPTVVTPPLPPAESRLPIPACRLAPTPYTPRRSHERPRRRPCQPLPIPSGDDYAAPLRCNRPGNCARTW